MPTLNMGRKRYPLTKELVKALVGKKAGNYALGVIIKTKQIDPKTGKKKTYNKFITRYVGRSDSNLQEEIIQQGIKLKVDKEGNPIYTYFAFSHSKIKAKTAYLMECENFHDFGGTQKLDNIRHPKRPKGFNKKTLACVKITCKN